MERAQVLIVGAGPVGTVAAAGLARHGIDVTLLEALPNWAQDLRGSTFHPPTLEMMAELGIADVLIEQGLVSPVYQYRERGSDEFLAFDLTELADMTAFPYRLQCEQFKLTRHLCQILAADPSVRLLYSHRATGFEQDARGVSVFAETAGSQQTFRADYVIAADGANSAIRKLAHIDFEGFTYPEKFITLSTGHPMERYFHGLSNVNYIADPQSWVLLLRTPDLWRVLVPAADELSDSHLLSDAYKDRVFADITGGADQIHTEHRTIYRVHQRVARRWRAGRVLLAGDAAHLNNPLGGFGMNSGIHDAFNLCEKLVAILTDGASDALLDLYEKQRQTVTREFIQTQSIRNKQMMEQSDRKRLAEQREEMRRIWSNDESRREYLLAQALFTSLADAARIRL